VPKNKNKNYVFQSIYIFTQVQKNCLYAVSTIARRFPLAQQQIIDNNGIQTFMSVFKRPQSDLNTKLKVSDIQFVFYD